MTLREHVNYWQLALLLKLEQVADATRRVFLWFAGTEDEDE